MELKFQIISTKPMKCKGRRSQNIQHILSCLVVEYFGQWLIFDIDREIQRKAPLFKIFKQFPEEEKKDTEPPNY